MLHECAELVRIVPAKIDDLRHDRREQSWRWISRWRGRPRLIELQIIHAVIFDGKDDRIPLTSNLNPRWQVANRRDCVTPADANAALAGCKRAKLRRLRDSVAPDD